MICDSSVSFFFKTSLWGIDDSFKFFSFGFGALYEPCLGISILPSNEGTESVCLKRRDVRTNNQIGKVQAEVFDATSQENEIVEATIDHLSGVFNASTFIKAIDNQLPISTVFLMRQRSAECPKWTCLDWWSSKAGWQLMTKPSLIWNLSKSSGSRKSTTKIEETLVSLLSFWLLNWIRASLESLLNSRFDLLFKKVEHTLRDFVSLHQLHQTLRSDSAENLLLSAGYLIVSQHFD